MKKNQSLFILILLAILTLGTLSIAVLHYKGYLELEVPVFSGSGKLKLDGRPVDHLKNGE